MSKTENAVAPVRRYAVRNAATGLLFCNHSMHPKRKSWDSLATAQVYLQRYAAEYTAREVLKEWERLSPHHPTLYPALMKPEVIEVELTVVA